MYIYWFVLDIIVCEVYEIVGPINNTNKEKEIWKCHNKYWLMIKYKCIKIIYYIIIVSNLRYIIFKYLKLKLKRKIVVRYIDKYLKMEQLNNKYMQVNILSFIRLKILNTLIGSGWCSGGWTIMNKLRKVEFL